jgi:hypothetical protein
MNSNTTLKAAAMVVLAGSIGLGGCEMAPGTYTMMSGADGTTGLQANATQTVSPTTRTANGTQPTTRTVSQTGTNRNLTLDPISTSLVGGGARSGDHSARGESADGNTLERGPEPVR